MKRRTLSLTRFALLAGLGVGVILALVWTLVLRERGIRRLYVEFEAFRASALLAESFRQNPGAVPSDDRVLGFGIYGSEGQALLRSGSAPARIKPDIQGTTPPPLRIEGSSLVLQRPLGPEAPGMPGMPGMRFMMRGGDAFGGPFGAISGPEARGAPPPGPAGARNPAPRLLWLEYGIGDYSRQRALLFLAAMVASAALLGFFALLLRLYRRNAELREAEIQSRELLQLGEAARTLVHEIKNPLGVIRVQAATLRRLDPDGAVERAREKAEMIDDEVGRLAGLADRIREFLKGGEGAATELELVEWFGIFSARYAESVERDGSAAPAAGWVRVDPERLSLALDNLIRNAFEASPSTKPRLVLRKRGRVFELVVGDRGPGIGTDLAARVFEPFFTTKEKGTGIGLSLARRVARAAGGDLEFRQREGGGTEFILSLPVLRSK